MFEWVQKAQDTMGDLAGGTGGDAGSESDGSGWGWGFFGDSTYKSPVESEDAPPEVAPGDDDEGGILDMLGEWWDKAAAAVKENETATATPTTAGAAPSSAGAVPGGYVAPPPAPGGTPSTGGGAVLTPPTMGAGLNIRAMLPWLLIGGAVAWVAWKGL